MIYKHFLYISAANFNKMKKTTLKNKICFRFCKKILFRNRE